MGIGCPSCGGKMIFDISGQVLKCEYCDTRIEVPDYKSNNEGEEQKVTYDTLVYTCRNCGAELAAPDEQVVAYCAYCGSEAMLSSRHEELLRPQTIIPFKKTKQQACDEYEKAIKGKLYVPKEYKSAQFLEGFRGIYLPYFSYEAVIPEKQIRIKGTANYSSGGYDYSEVYDIDAAIGGRTRGVSFDASSAFDDTIANEIAPFNEQDEEDFHEGYLAGFYADKTTTDERTYMTEATQLTVDSIYEDVERNVQKVQVDRENTIDQEKEKIGIGAIDCNVSYFPVWFLTWRNKNRVAYSVMNGQSGKMATDIPVDKKKFFLVSLIAAAVIFVILSLLPIFILPSTISMIAGVVLVISGIILHREIKAIYERESHVYDYGDTQHTAKKKRVKARATGDSKPSGMKIGFIAVALLIVLYIVTYGFSMISSGGRTIGALETFGGKGTIFMIALPFQLYFSIRTISNAARLEKRSAIIPAILALVVIVAGIVIGIMNPAHDFWYYGTALACLAAVLVNCISAANYFNFLNTRPVPNFFGREGADNEK